jgi:TatA/E family protein of Tat protein translocase
MFGTMGFSELIIILVIVLIIFGAGKLPQIGEGVGKALKGFKKEVHDIPPAAETTPGGDQQPSAAAHIAAPSAVPAASHEPAFVKSLSPPAPGPELTPGTTAALLANLGPQGPAPGRSGAETAATPPDAPLPSGRGVGVASTQAPPTMEDRLASPAPMVQAQYPPLPAGSRPKPVAKRPSAIVNKDAVARVQAAQAAMKSKAGTKASEVSPQDMQHFGEGLGDALRTFRQAVADVRSSVDPEMRTIQAEIDSAHKELEQSIEAAKQAPVVEERSSATPS